MPFRITVPERDFTTEPQRVIRVRVPLRRFGYLNTPNQYVYDPVYDPYPPDRWVNWGQRNIQPFFFPWGTDSTKTLEEIENSI